MNFIYFYLYLITQTAAIFDFVSIQLFSQTSQISFVVQNIHNYYKTVIH